MTPVRPRPATVVVVVATLVLLTVLLVRGRDVLGWALAPLVMGALALMAYDCARGQVASMSWPAPALPPYRNSVEPATPMPTLTWARRCVG